MLHFFLSVFRSIFFAFLWCTWVPRDQSTNRHKPINQPTKSIAAVLAPDLNRVIFLETVAGIPGMVAGTLRHLTSLRRMRRYVGKKEERRVGGGLHTHTHARALLLLLLPL